MSEVFSCGVILLSNSQENELVCMHEKISRDAIISFQWATDQQWCGNWLALKIKYMKLLYVILKRMYLSRATWLISSARRLKNQSGFWQGMPAHAMLLDFLDASFKTYCKQNPNILLICSIQLKYFSIFDLSLVSAVPHIAELQPMERNCQFAGYKINSPC